MNAHCARAVLVWIAALLCIGFGATAAFSAVPSSVWQDNDRTYRKQGGISLSQEQREAQAAKARTVVVEPGRMPSQGNLSMQGPEDWRLRIREAAVVSGTTVTLGEIAEPYGPIPPDTWRTLSVTPLWPAPSEAGKPLSVNKARLQQALREALGDTASRCIVPGSLVIQRGGMVLREDDLRSYTVRFLTPQLGALPGQAELTEFRLPPYIFLEHPQQRVALEPGKLAPGRLSLRFVVQEMDGTVLRRVAGTAFLNVWLDAPAAARPLNKGDTLGPADVTFMRMNAAHIKGMPWDGRGGPWQVMRTLAPGQPIFQADLATQALVRKGSIVHMLYAKGNLQMSVQAESLADGEPGAKIPVRNLQSKKQVHATVQDGRTVIAQ